MAAIPLSGAGWLLFTALGCAVHRDGFHWTPKSDLLAQVVCVMHGNHHMQPTDKLRALMPPIVSFPIGFAVSVLLGLAFGAAGDWMLFGFLLGYAAYDLTHYASHHASMRGPLARVFKRHHMLHHFISEHGNYAVTGLFWDRVFGTSIKASDQRTFRPSAAARVEEVEPAE